MLVEKTLFATWIEFEGEKSNKSSLHRTDVYFLGKNLGTEISRTGMYAFKTPRKFKIRNNSFFCVQRLFYHHSCGFVTYKEAIKKKIRQVG